MKLVSLLGVRAESSGEELLRPAERVLVAALGRKEDSSDPHGIIISEKIF